MSTVAREEGFILFKRMENPSENPNAGGLAESMAERERKTIPRFAGYRHVLP